MAATRRRVARPPPAVLRLAPDAEARGDRKGNRTDKLPRRTLERGRSRGFPTVHDEPTNKEAVWERPRMGGAADQRIPAWDSLVNSSCYSLRIALDRTGLRRRLRAAHDGNEEIGDARRAHIAEGVELPAVAILKQQNAAAEELALVDWVERPRGSQMLWARNEFRVAPFQFIHAAVQHDAAAVDEREIGEDMLHLLDLMR